MLPNTFSLRRTALAYVFPANPGLSRDENLAFYDKVTSAGLEVPEFKQQPASVHLSRRIAGNRPNVFEVSVGEHQKQFRLLIAEEWPTKAMTVFEENAEIVWDSFREVWPLKRLGQRPILVEASLRLEAAVDGGDATEFLGQRCMHLPGEALSRLGRGVQGFGLQLMLPLELRPAAEQGDMPLAGATCKVRIETLMDDPSKLYFEIVAKWPAVPVPQEVREATGAPDMLNPAPLKPKVYLDAAYGYVTNQVSEFLLTAGG